MAEPTYSLTFCGVPFVPDTAKLVRMKWTPGDTSSEMLGLTKFQPMVDLIDEISRTWSLELLQDFSIPLLPGRNLNALGSTATPDPQPNPELPIGSFYYPFGAGRWSVFRMLATSSQAAAMLSQTATGGPGEFVMQCTPSSPNPANSYNITTEMYMLPPRCIGETAGSVDGLYLITLVDDRYFFQSTPATLRPIQGSTWTSLLQDVAQGLGITLTIPTIPDVYGLPAADSQLWANLENSAQLLDALAYNVGCQVVRNYDGTYVLQNPTQSQAIVSSNRGDPMTVVRLAGGDIFSSGTQLPIGDLTPARNTVVPTHYNVVFPKYVLSDPVPHFLNPRYQNQRDTCWFEDGYGDVFLVEVPISSGGPNVSGLTGVSENTLYTTSKALYSGEVNAASGMIPLNVSGLTALAVQLAVDKYDAAVISALDEVYPGTVAWTPEGLHDVVWTWSAKNHLASTRVMRTEWNVNAFNFQHATFPLPNMTSVVAGVGGPSVAQAWRDSVGNSGLTIASLNSSVTASDTSFSFSTIGNFPSQNRWAGKVGDESILFEGTSGSATVHAVNRGWEGTIAAAHGGGDQVVMQVPNATYGVNLVTFEKGQYVHTDYTTSGGVAGAVVVPQTQTVQILSASGVTLNGQTCYSGSLQLFGPPVNGFQTQENIWVFERNNIPVVSGRKYDGQYVGPSDSGTVAPLYCMNEYPSSGTVITSGSIPPYLIGSGSFQSGAIWTYDIASGITISLASGSVTTYMLASGAGGGGGFSATLYSGLTNSGTINSGGTPITVFDISDTNGVWLTASLLGNLPQSGSVAWRVGAIDMFDSSGVTNWYGFSPSYHSFTSVSDDGTLIKAPLVLADATGMSGGYSVRVPFKRVILQVDTANFAGTYFPAGYAVQLSRGM